MKEKTYLTWADIDKLTDTLCNKINSSNYKISWIYGFPRGGLIPAVLISHKLNIPLTTELKGLDNVICIDDICDTGNTLETLSNIIPYTASLILKKSSNFIPDLYAKEVNDDLWYNFPWERRDSNTIPDNLKNQK